MTQHTNNNHSPNTIDEGNNYFSLVLASTVHDMKNSLAMLGESLNQILNEHCDLQKNKKAKKDIGIVQYESNRVNNSLMQLLALYKLENEQLPYNPNYHNLYDFIEEQTIILAELLEAKDIQCNVNVDESIDAFFDANLLAIAVENVIGNAIRYTNSTININCFIDDYLIIQINDDGQGYPQKMIDLQGSYMQSINQSTGSTGLGLFFSEKIAFMHQNKSKTGFIELKNGGELKGGLFELHLP